MDLRQLRYFVAVAEELSFRSAARRLNLTEPPLSRQVRLLEDELGVRVFVRDKKRIYLTEEGHMLLRESKKLLKQANNIIETIGRKKSPHSGKIKVGIAYSIGTSIGSAAFAFSKRFPHIDVEYRDIYSIDQHHSLTRKEIDIGFWRPSADSEFLLSEPLYREPLLAIVRKDHGLAHRAELSKADFANETIHVSNRLSRALHDYISTLVNDTRDCPKIVSTSAAPSEAGIISLASSKGIYIVSGNPEKYAVLRNDISIIPIRDENAFVDVHIVRRSDENSSTTINFYNIVRDSFRL